MKNIHLIPTDKPSRLYHTISMSGYKLHLSETPKYKSSELRPQNLYITNDETIKVGDWFHTSQYNTIDKLYSNGVINTNYCKKIILTTDQDLIKDGIQPINDEFLEWFVNNPSCEEVEVVKIDTFKKTNEVYVDEITGGNYYEIIKHNKIIIPKEEQPKTN
jgi:hypothetical protein